jgi:hypothetical protein
VTVTYGSGQFADSIQDVREYSGVVTSSPLDQIMTANDNGNYVQSHPSGTTPATTQASELVVTGFGISNNDTYTGGTGYGNLSQANGFDLYTSEAAEDKIISSTGAQSDTINTSGFDTGQGVIATFKAAAATSNNPSQSQVVINGGAQLIINGGAQLIIQ